MIKHPVTNVNCVTTDGQLVCLLARPTFLNGGSKTYSSVKQRNGRKPIRGHLCSQCARSCSSPDWVDGNWHRKLQDSWNSCFPRSSAISQIQRGPYRYLRGRKLPQPGSVTQGHEGPSRQSCQQHAHPAWPVMNFTVTQLWCYGMSDLHSTCYFLMWFYCTTLFLPFKTTRTLIMGYLHTALVPVLWSFPNTHLLLNGGTFGVSCADLENLFFFKERKIIHYKKTTNTLWNRPIKLNRNDRSVRLVFTIKNVRRLDLGWQTQYNVQMMYMELCTWNLHNFVNQCHSIKFH